MPAEHHTIVFTVTSKTLTQATVINTEGEAVLTEVTSVTFIPQNEEGLVVTGSFSVVSDDPDLYTLGASYEATFVEIV